MTTDKSQWNYWFIGAGSWVGLMKSIKNLNLTQARIYVKAKISPPYDNRPNDLDECFGIAFFGQQDTVFQNEQEYFDFLEAAENEKIPIAAVLGYNGRIPEQLPNKNQGIHRVFRSCTLSKGRVFKRPVTFIGRDLIRHLDAER